VELQHVLIREIPFTHYDITSHLAEGTNVPSLLDTVADSLLASFPLHPAVDATCKSINGSLLVQNCRGSVR